MNKGEMSHAQQKHSVAIPQANLKPMEQERKYILLEELFLANIYTPYVFQTVLRQSNIQ